MSDLDQQTLGAILLGSLLKSRGKNNSIHDIERAGDLICDQAQEISRMKEALESIASGTSDDDLMFAREIAQEALRPNPPKGQEQ